MKHPFEAILTSDGDTPSRRQMMGRAVSAGAAVMGLATIAPAAENSDSGSGSSSKESSKPPAKKEPTKPQPTTERLGEEGGPRASTAAVGEEGGRVTTQAIGEEGGGPTTKAVGEEGGVRPAPPKFKALKGSYDAAMKAGDLRQANSALIQMSRHPESEANKKVIDEAKAALNKIALASLEASKAAAEKKDLITAIEKVREVETLYAVDARKEAMAFHKKLRMKKGYKQASREVSARRLFASAEQAKAPAQKRRIFEVLARSYGDTETGKKAAAELKKLPPAPPKPKPNPGRVTTLALGEEG